MLEAKVERVEPGEAVELDQQLEVTAATGREGPKGPVVGVVAVGEGDRAKGDGVADELSGPGDLRGPPEGYRGVDQPTRAGEIAIDQQAARAKRRELDAPAFRATCQVEGELGRRGALCRAADLELDVPPDPLPENASPPGRGPRSGAGPAERGRRGRATRRRAPHPRAMCGGKVGSGSGPGSPAG